MINREWPHGVAFDLSPETQKELAKWLMPWGCNPFSMSIACWLACECERLGLPREMIAGDIYPATVENNDEA